MEISNEGLPHFGKSRVDGYKLSAIILFPDLKKKRVQTAVEESSVLPLKGKHSPLDVTVSVPGRASCFILCVRIDGCNKGEVYYTIATKGMAVIAAGALLPARS